MEEMQSGMVEEGLQMPQQVCECLCVCKCVCVHLRVAAAAELVDC